MTRKIEAIIESKLQDDETLLWVQQPNPMLVASQGILIFGAGLGLLLAPMVCVIFSNPLSTEGISPIIQCMFWGMIGSGVFLTVFLIIRPYLTYRNALTTIYALTNKRLIIYENNQSGEKIMSYGRRDIQGLVLKERADGYGNLLFSSQLVATRYGAQSVPLGFIGITKSPEVRQLIIDTFGFDKDDFWQD